MMLLWSRIFHLQYLYHNFLAMPDLTPLLLELCYKYVSSMFPVIAKYLTPDSKKVVNR